ncbi:ABC transporter permease [Sphaerisporangium rufum]|uniref:ABC transporter permease n=1 Tax=Sphaerisporangium rufum TaxID=1381558 RepID=A0A919UYX1_9ACTN|nr:ABC transporter permease subunit [Sphaerisporangium rufum]GII77204.1 ABC transporter permease [Sphaerisporangium rufum]
MSRTDATARTGAAPEEPPATGPADGPGVVIDGADRPAIRVATPDAATPDAATSDVATPDAATPDAATSDVATSDAAASGGAPASTPPGGAMPDAGASGAPARARPVAGTWRLLRSELGLTFRRPRNLVLLALLAVVPVVIGVVLRAMGGGGPSIIAQAAGNGLMLTFGAMSVVAQLHLPLAVAVVAGDAVAGEAGTGTLRYLLTAPAGRTRLLLVKFADIAVYAAAACAVVTAAALLTGLALFPAGPVTLLSGTTISFADGLLRVLAVTGYAAVGMAAFGAVGLAVSTLTEAPIGAVAATVGAVVCSNIFGLIPQLEPVRPYLITSWWGEFDGVLRDPVAVDTMTQGLLVFAAYIAVFGTVAWARFTGRDITG